MEKKIYNGEKVQIEVVELGFKIQMLLILRHTISWLPIVLNEISTLQIMRASVGCG